MSAVRLSSRWTNGGATLGDNPPTSPILLTLAVAATDRPSTANVIVDHVDIEGNPLPVCSRSLLTRMVDGLAQRGLTAKCAFEIEGMVFDEPLKAARAKGFLRPLLCSTRPFALSLSCSTRTLRRALMHGC